MSNRKADRGSITPNVSLASALVVALLGSAAMFVPGAAGAAPGPVKGADRAWSDSAKQRYRVAMDHYRHGRFEEAAREFRLAEALVPPDGKARLAFNLGRALDRCGDLAGAIEWYDRYVALAPEAADRALRASPGDALGSGVNARQAPRGAVHRG